MTEKPDAFTALWKSKKYLTTLVWLSYTISVGTRTSNIEVAKWSLLAGSIGFAAYLLAQGLQDAFGKKE